MLGTAICAAYSRAHQYRALPGVRGKGIASDIGEAGDVGEGALEAEAKAGVWHRALSSAQQELPEKRRGTNRTRRMGRTARHRHRCIAALGRRARRVTNRIRSPR
jgi:hypothetical protein